MKEVCTRNKNCCIWEEIQMKYQDKNTYKRWEMEYTYLKKISLCLCKEQNRWRERSKRQYWLSSYMEVEHVEIATWLQKEKCIGI